MGRTKKKEEKSKGNIVGWGGGEQMGRNCLYDLKTRG